MTFSPVILSFDILSDENGSNKVLRIAGTGIENADSDFEYITLNFSNTSGFGAQLSLTASNRSKVAGPTSDGNISSVNENGWLFEFPLKDDIVLPNANFNQVYYSAKRASEEFAEQSYNDGFDWSLSFGGVGNGVIPALESFETTYNQINENQTEIIFSGKVEPNNLQSLNHIKIDGYVDTSNVEEFGRSIGFRHTLKADEVDDTGNFQTKYLSWNVIPDGSSSYNSVHVVSNDGMIASFQPSWDTQELIESHEAPSYDNSDFVEQGSKVQLFNVNSSYVLPGEQIFFDINHLDANIESQITYNSDFAWTWGDDLNDWLDVSSTGLMEGTVPQNFESGGGNITFEHPIYGINYVDWMRISSPFIEANNGREMKIGDSWINLHEALDGSVLINSVSSGTQFNGQYIDGNSITLADGGLYTLDQFESFRNGVGIEVHTSKNDDYVDLSGYEQSDFFATDRGQMIDITTSPGNDTYIAPSFKIDGEYVGVLDNQHYFQYADYLGLDNSGGLEINWLEGGSVRILDQTNGYISDAENIHQVQTSEFSNDVVRGDSEDNSFYSYGGTDTFFGADGKDDFSISYSDKIDESGLEHKIIIEDYQSGERISIKKFGFSSDFNNEGSVRFDAETGYTIVSRKHDENYLQDIVNIKGFWDVDSAYLSDDGTLHISASNPLDIDSLIEGTGGNDHLAAFGSVWKYDEESSFITKDLVINGREGRDDIAGGAGNDTLDGGEEPELNEYGRDVNQQGKHVVDRLHYTDAQNGIIADFSTGLVANDGFGSTDYVSNFERIYGSYHDDVVVLSQDIFGGYVPSYGNDTISSSFDVQSVNNPYLAYWNLENASSGLEPNASADVEKAHIVSNFDQGTVDKYIVGGEFDISDSADFQDNFEGIEGIFGSRGDDIMYAHSYLGTSIMLGGERHYTFGWLVGNEGDDKVIALGSGDDAIDGGGGDDLIISVGNGQDIDKLAGHGSSRDYPNYNTTDQDTFVIGGEGTAIIEDFEIGEELILLDFDITELTDFEAVYDFSEDQTRISIFDGEELLEDRLLINGNVQVSKFETLTFYEEALNHSADPSLNNDIEDIKVILEASNEVPGEIIEGGEGADVLYGTGGVEFVRSGGGNDTISVGGGDDLVIVQGQGDVEVDTGSGDDRVVVEDGWSGTLFVKNGTGSNILEILGNQEDMDVGFVDGKVQLTIGNGSAITIDEQFVMNSQTGKVELSENGFEYIKTYGYDANGNALAGEYAYASYFVLGSEEDNLLIANQPSDAEANDEVFIMAGDGADIIEGNASNLMIEGGRGDDLIRIAATSGNKSVFGDIFTGDSGGNVQTQNSSYSDVVELDWSYDASEITQIGSGYRIYNDDLDATVDIYDVEILKFANDDGTWDTRYLTDGAPIGPGDFDVPAGTDVNYGDGSSVRFVLTDNSISSSEGKSSWLQVYAQVTETHMVEESYFTGRYVHKNGKSRSTPRSGYKPEYKTREVEQSTESEKLVWEGDKTSVDAFTFSDGVVVNVINVADKDWNDQPIEMTLGTDGIDLIFGNDSDNLIDAGLGDDIIFGGDGDDVIIGGEGDDILLGGDGDDIIRGDTVTDQDAALEYFAELTNYDDSQLSIDNSDMGTSGDDVILGGDGIDDIDSGDGTNFVTTGRMDLDDDGEADLDTVKDFMDDNNIDNKDIFDNDDWI